MAYNMTPVEESFDLFSLFSAVNTASGNILVNFGVFVLWAIVFFALLKNNAPVESFVASSGACTIIMLFFLALGLTDIAWVIGFTLVFAMSAIGAYLRNKTT